MTRGFDDLTLTMTKTIGDTEVKHISFLGRNTSCGGQAEYWIPNMGCRYTQLQQWINKVIVIFNTSLLIAIYEFSCQLTAD